ncbi:right-handed parallel beta-helix repeat-containing protein [Paenibacillus sp. MBLB2552]|uniref:Right-handed parallel beta-helix repeat-containing protein n=1 Tax=Paenibacillus mellifer TaxID=2937794 RepID=A0A9X1XXZ1_9BACL|nr:right-handed parallel beta-helix repeat-containing protein [Paenibacillus mellifer]MCK8487317.1 right-handed parallel beta-helix repeat-containing protein [Paenibacillus mellifer]
MNKSNFPRSNDRLHPGGGGPRRHQLQILLLVLLILALSWGLLLRWGPSFPFPAPTFNVKEAGAKGDGIADDTRVFLRVLRQAAATGRDTTVIVPPGTYLLALDEPLPLRSGVTLRGLGRPVLKFRAISVARYGFEAVSIQGRGIRIDGVVIDGGARLTRGIGIHSGSSDVAIVGSTVQDLNQPEELKHPLSTTVVAGIMIYGDTVDIKILGCTLTEIAAREATPVARGIMAWSEPGRTIARRVNIKGNLISYISPREDADGIYFDQPPGSSPLSDSVISDNILHHTAKRGIKISAPGVVVKNNRILNPYSRNNRYLAIPKDALPQDMYAAISIYAGDVTVSGNIIGGSGSYYAAIEADVGGAGVVVIEHNVIESNASPPFPNSSGIRLDQIGGFRIIGNAISGAETPIRLSEEAREALTSGAGTLADNTAE